ncbi:hypothetical protein KZJ38_21550 [Paraburkholderia edwinii]|uniref:Uncharacterized protein n=1 Tax=Paraburkholderia edwinii TaxID=2861782 RepID=A0ABX8UP51_9BURK|nr:hypothetical protein [Paraburkholderia edwinii]QYD68769.1 hypothetical protein KZJ38_21550 [Paraburkholderia edwinii]
MANKPDVYRIAGVTLVWGAARPLLQFCCDSLQFSIVFANRPLNLDLPACTELLTFLVVSHLLARSMTGEWLSPEHVVESTHMWLSANGANTDWLQRVMLSSRALDVAKQVARASPSMADIKSVSSMLCENLRLDFRSPAARSLYGVCLNYLAGRMSFTWL